MPESTTTRLQPIAFTLQPEFVRTPITIEALTFPDSWRAPLRQLQGERHVLSEQQAENDQPIQNELPIAGKHATFPIASLNTVMAALVPQLVSLPGQAREPYGSNAPDPWLLAWEEIPARKLMQVVLGWMEIHFQSCPSYRELVPSFRAADLRWQPVTLDFDRPPLPHNNTSDPAGLAYRALPALLAARLQERGATMRVYGEPCAFIRVPADRGAELMTWPPMAWQEGDQRGYFSYVLRLTVQTLIGNPCPRVHMTFSTRRWVARSLFNQEGGIRLGSRGRTVYLTSEDNWIAAMPVAACTVARIRATWKGEKRVLDWDDQVPAIANRVWPALKLPTAAELGAKPEEWLAGTGLLQAAIVEQTPRNYGVGTGVGLEERAAFVAELAPILAPELNLVPPVERLKELHHRPGHTMINDLREASAEDRLSAFVQSVGAQATIEIWYEDPAKRDHLVDAVHRLLCRPRPPVVDYVDAKGKVWRKREEPPPPESALPEQEIALPDGGRIRLMTRPADELVAPFPDPDGKLGGLSRAVYKRRRTQDRIDAIRKAIPENATEPTLVIIELRNFQSIALRRQFGARDPKRALRVGLARTRRASKFLASTNDNLHMLAENTVRDGLRQLGYLPAPIGYHAPEDRSIPKRVVVAGVWIVRRTRKRANQPIQIPFVVLLHTAESQVRAWLPDGKGTRSYYEALIDLTAVNPKLVERRNQAEILRQLEHFLTVELPRECEDDMVVVADAQNARDIWKGLQNSVAAFDRLRFARNGRELEREELPAGFRLIRVRTNDQQETPQWFADGVTEAGKGYYQGIWIDPATPRLFYNNSGKPNTQSASRQGRQVDPTEQVAIPSFLEVQPLILPEGEPPAAWALAIDQWRRMGFLTNEMTLRPLPLDWASHADKYAETIGPWAEEGLWAEEEEDDEDEPMQLMFDLWG